jgi:hypothetical protein
LTKKWIGINFGRYFQNSSGHSVRLSNFQVFLHLFNNKTRIKLHRLNCGTYIYIHTYILQKYYLHTQTSLSAVIGCPYFLTYSVGIKVCLCTRTVNFVSCCRCDQRQKRIADATQHKTTACVKRPFWTMYIVWSLITSNLYSKDDGHIVRIWGYILTPIKVHEGHRDPLIRMWPWFGPGIFSEDAMYAILSKSKMLNDKMSNDKMAQTTNTFRLYIVGQTLLGT